MNDLLAALGGAEPRLAGAVIEGLAAGWPGDAILTLNEPARGALQQLRTRLSLEDQVHLARLVQHAGGREAHDLRDVLTSAMLARAENQGLADAERLRAAELLVDMAPDDREIPRRLLALITPSAPPDFCQGLVDALRNCRHADLGALLLERAAEFPPAAREAAFDLMLARPALTTALLDAIESGAVAAGDLSLVQKNRLAEHPDGRLRDRASAVLAQGRQNISQDRQRVLAEFADVARAPGDAAAGREVFTKNCAICHKLRGEGAAIGPDLSGMAVHGKEQLLVHILDPNRDVEGNYVSYVALTADGLVISGMMAGESATSVELVDAQGKRHAILREDVEQLTRSNASLMPEGFEKQLSREQLANLLAYLTDNARFVPLDLQRIATVSSARGMFNSPESTVERLVFDQWGPKVVDGVPFYPIDPQDGRIRNVVMLYGPQGRTAPTMPRSVELKCGLAVRALHFLSGVSGWGYPATPERSVSMIVRLHYADGENEDHKLLNGVHFADYLGAAEVEGSQRAFSLGRQQVRYFKIEPKRRERLETVSLVKGDDPTAPLVLAVTAEKL